MNANGYYCAVHPREDQSKLAGEPLDACNVHMIHHNGYFSQDTLRALMTRWTVWKMVPDGTAQYGYRFGEIIKEEDLL